MLLVRFNPSIITVVNRPFPSSLGSLYQNEVKCSAFDMEIIFHSHANKTHFHKKGCAPSLILKVRVFGTRKWPIVSQIVGCQSFSHSYIRMFTVPYFFVRSFRYTAYYRHWYLDFQMYRGGGRRRL